MCNTLSTCAVDHIIIESHISNFEDGIAIHILAPLLEIIEVKAVSTWIDPVPVELYVTYRNNRIVKHIIPVAFHAVLCDSIVPRCYDVVTEGQIACVEGWISIHIAAPITEKVYEHGMGVYCCNPVLVKGYIHHMEGRIIIHIVSKMIYFIEV